jgi:hypothetical protein
MEISLAHDLDLEKVKFSSVKQVHGHKFISMYYKKNPLLIHFPRMTLPFGINMYKGKFSLDLSFNNLKTNKNMKDFYNGMRAIEKLVEEYGKNNMKDLFHSKNADIQFKSCLTEKNPFDPIIKAKLNQDKENNFKFKLFNDNHDEIEFDQETIQEFFPKKKQLKGIIECSGVWVSERDEGFVYGISWKVNQVKIYSDIEDLCFIEDSDVESTDFLSDDE